MKGNKDEKVGRLDRKRTKREEKRRGIRNREKVRHMELQRGK